MRAIIFLILPLAFSCGSKEPTSSEQKFWDLPELIDEWKAEGDIEDTELVDPTKCEEVFDAESGSKSLCRSLQKATLSQTFSCADSSEPIAIEADSMSSKLELCYEASAGYKKTFAGDIHAEFRAGNQDGFKKVDAGLELGASLLDVEVDVFDMDFDMDGSDLSAGGSVMAFGQEIWSQSSKAPQVKLAYMASDSLRDYRLTYGFPISFLPVYPSLSMEVEVAGDFFLGIQPQLTSDNEFRLAKRVSGGVYARPALVGSLQVLGFDLVKASLGGFAELASDDIGIDTRLRTDRSLRFAANEHRSSLASGSIYASADLKAAKFTHYFFGKQTISSLDKPSCDSNQAQVGCSCKGLVADLKASGSKWSLFADAAMGSSAIERESAAGMICDPISSIWIPSSDPVWTKDWQQKIYDTRN